LLDLWDFPAFEEHPLWELRTLRGGDGPPLPVRERMRGQEELPILCLVHHLSKHIRAALSSQPNSLPGSKIQ
jgi:hypothetical protein